MPLSFYQRGPQIEAAVKATERTNRAEINTARPSGLLHQQSIDKTYARSQGWSQHFEKRRPSDQRNIVAKTEMDFTVKATRQSTDEPALSHDETTPTPRSVEDERNELLSLRQALFEANRENILYTLTRHEPDGQVAPASMVLNMAAVQRLHLQDLQERIAYAFRQDLDHGPGSDRGLFKLLDNGVLWRYCHAVRDLDFTQACARRGFDNDPFLLMSSRQLDREILTETGLLPKYLDPAGELPPAVDADNPAVFGAYMPRNATNQAQALKRTTLRFAAASFGGLALVAPMIIMVRVPGELSSLLTTSGFTLGFAAALATWSDLGPEQILGVTAAYAAVLVVFVGASLTPSSPQSGKA